MTKTIQEIYTTYIIPPNVVRHMKQVAAVGMFCISNWTGPQLDNTSLIEALLLHDLGNIIKFKQPFMGELTENLEYWIKVQEEYKQKYGNDVHHATISILKDIHVLPSCINIVEGMKTIAMEHNIVNMWEAKIGDFCDTCVTPQGIEGFDARVQDLVTRYNLDEKSQKVQNWKENANEVSKYLSINIHEVQSFDFSQYLKNVKNTSIRTVI